MAKLVGDEDYEKMTEIDDNDLRIDIFSSRIQAGGQTVCMSDSGVRVTHLPTGIVVESRDEKSQHKNKAKALEILRKRLDAQACHEERQRFTREHHEKREEELKERNAEIQTLKATIEFLTLDENMRSKKLAIDNKRLKDEIKRLEVIVSRSFHM